MPLLVLSCLLTLTLSGGERDDDLLQGKIGTDVAVKDEEKPWESSLGKDWEQSQVIAKGQAKERCECENEACTPPYQTLEKSPEGTKTCCKMFPEKRWTRWKRAASSMFGTKKNSSVERNAEEEEHCRINALLRKFSGKSCCCGSSKACSTHKLGVEVSNETHSTCCKEKVGTCKVGEEEKIGADLLQFCPPNVMVFGDTLDTVSDLGALNRNAKKVLASSRSQVTSIVAAITGRAPEEGIASMMNDFEAKRMSNCMFEKLKSDFEEGCTFTLSEKRLVTLNLPSAHIGKSINLLFDALGIKNDTEIEDEWLIPKSWHNSLIGEPVPCAILLQYVILFPVYIEIHEIFQSTSGASSTQFMNLFRRKNEKHKTHHTFFTADSLNALLTTLKQLLYDLDALRTKSDQEYVTLSKKLPHVTEEERTRLKALSHQAYLQSLNDSASCSQSVKKDRTEVMGLLEDMITSRCKRTPSNKLKDRCGVGGVLSRMVLGKKGGPDGCAEQDGRSCPVGTECRCAPRVDGNQIVNVGVGIVLTGNALLYSALLICMPIATPPICLMNIASFPDILIEAPLIALYATYKMATNIQCSCHLKKCALYKTYNNANCGLVNRDGSQSGELPFPGLECIYSQGMTGSSCKYRPLSAQRCFELYYAKGKRERETYKETKWSKFKTFFKGSKKSMEKTSTRARLYKFLMAPTFGIKAGLDTHHCMRDPITAESLCNQGFSDPKECQRYR